MNKIEDKSQSNGESSKEESNKKDIKDLNEEEEKKKLEAEEESRKFPPVNYFKLQFSLANCKDIFYFTLGIIGATAMGIAFPIFAIIFGSTMNDLNYSNMAALTDNIGGLAKKLIWCGLGMFGGTVFNIYFSILAGEGIIHNIKQEYFKALLRQEQGFYDSRNAFEFSTKVQSQIKQIQMGLGQKVGNAVFSLVMFISAYVVGFIVSWKLSLVLCGVVPLMVAGGYCMIASLTDSLSKARKYFEQAGGIAEEVLYNIKTVSSFANYQFEKARFSDKVDESYEKGKYGGTVSSASRAFVFFLIFGSYALAIGVGAVFIGTKEPKANSSDTFKVGDILTVIFTIIFGSFSLGQAAPNIKAISAACEASREFFYLKERKPEIDLSLSIEKPSLETIKGEMEFKNISFSYPSKLERKILHNLNLKFVVGQTTAIVGETGSGKSTIVNMIERLYDPIEGEILLDGTNIKRLDLEYFRSMIGYVPQEPVLFNASLKENILFGRKDVTDEEINEACVNSYVSEFLPNLDKGLLTKVGLKGSKLSGGQKQRVAIARAILKKPKILILDEATSALDYRSEKMVKQALEIVSSNVTTIIIAHRLSTIRNAKTIVVLNKGEIQEIGDHDSLFGLKGLYFNLVKNQESIDNQNVDEKKEEKLVLSEYNGILNTSEKQIVSEKEQLKGQERRISEASNTEKRKSSIADIKLEIQKKKMLLEDENISIEQKKKILEEEEKLKDEQLKDAKKLLWPLLCEQPCVLTVATINACIDGVVWPIYGFLLAETIDKLSITDSDQLRKNGAFLAGMFLILAAVSGVANFFVGNLFTIMGEYLAKRLRIKCYEKYLQLHMAYFDYTENSPGALLTKLASDTLKINGVALSMSAVIFETIVTLIVGIVLGFVFSWQLALICLGFVPFMIIAAAVGIKMQMGYAKTDEIKEKELGNLLSECVTNTKTIYCFNMQSKVTQYYSTKLSEGGIPYVTYFFSSLISGLSQFLMFAVYAVTFYVGAKLVADPTIGLTFLNMLRSIFSLLFASFGLGMVQQYLGDMDEAKKALVSLHNVLSTDSEIDPQDASEGKIIADPKTFVSKIEFRNVSFRYPLRPETTVFNNLSFTIESGQQVAFVGFSGSGKSTIVQLLLRFYDVDAGEILVNDINIRNYMLESLRKMMGIVMQEPVLFKTNVYNNIKYGNLENWSTERILDCAKKALVPRIEQITPENRDALPVSGGEKQRIAIARCMLRDPKILLLDEATSALDKNVEDEVQKALDVLTVGRTSIVIAHRLSTIVNCNKIFFLEHGVIKEGGSHQELLERKGKYYNLFMSGQNKK